jgi:hypothetical protein
MGLYWLRKTRSGGRPVLVGQGFSPDNNASKINATFRADPQIGSADLPVGCHAGLLARVRDSWGVGAANTAGLETGAPSS